MSTALSSPAATPPRPPHPSANHSPSTLALLSLSQDITALISLSLEATASLAHDWYRSTLGLVGLGRVVPLQRERSSVKGEAGRGLAIIILGAHEATGQSLVLNLAKSGYTTFPLLPLLPTSTLDSASTPLSSLLLRWSSTQKRLRARNPGHPGAVVPIILDDREEYGWKGGLEDESGSGSGSGKFRHAGDTVRAYCRENGLCLVGIVCATTGHGTTYTPESSSRDISLLSKAMITSPPSSPIHLSLSPTSRYQAPSPTLSADQQILLEAYKANVLDPLSLIKELRDILSVPAHSNGPRGRVIFVNPRDSRMDGSGGGERAFSIVDAARGEVTRLLSGELANSGIDVCEVVVGPMTTRMSAARFHLRHGSDDSTESDFLRYKLIKGASDHSVAEEGKEPEIDTRIQQRLALISRIWAVDDALLFSSVRRAIEDRYPRYRHHAGLTPFLESLSEVVPGGGIVKALRRWALGRLLRANRGRDT